MNRREALDLDRYLTRSDEPFTRALGNEAEALRQRQLRAAEELMALPIPRDLRFQLRAFHDSLEPSIVDHEMTA